MSKGKNNVSGRPDTRPTIAYLAPEAVFGPTPMSLWSGVESGARQHDLNLIAFPGGNIHDKRRRRDQANIIYDFITPETIAGLVTWAAALQHSGVKNETLSEEELSALHTRYDPLPIVTLSKAVPGYPVVLVENEQGMRDAVAHLIEVHGCRRIAFIRGPETHPLAEARYHAYLDTLAGHGIEVNADLITPPGDFSTEHGARAVDLFLDQRNLRPKADIEAIVTVSDVPALGAMDALQRRDIRVPEDMAVVGFNNSAEARSASPSITSVTVPFQEQGSQAIDVLKRLLEGESLPDEILVPSRLAIHQSCGCLDATVAQAGTFSPGADKRVFLKKMFVPQRETIVQEMVQTMDISEVPNWAERVLDAFILDLGQSQPGEFLTALREVIRRATLTDRTSPAWQNVLSVLQRYAVSCVTPKKALLLIGQARTMLGETSSRAFAQRQLQAERRVQTLQTISSDLIATFEVARLMDVLAEGLPNLNIPSCYLALYEDPQPYEYPQQAPDWSRLILAYNEEGRVTLEPDGRRFPTRHLLPKGMLLAHRRYTMVLQPLYFQDAQIGFVLFEVGPQDWSVYDMLRTQIASALQGALLVQQEEKRAGELETVAEVSTATSTILDTAVLLQKVVDLTKERFGLYHAHLYLLNDAGDTLELAAGAGETGRKMVAEGWHIPLNREQSLVARAARNRRGEIANDVQAEANWFANPYLPDTKSEMAVPLLVGERVMGVLDVQSAELSHFTDDDVRTKSTLATQVAVALENALLFAETTQSKEAAEIAKEKAEQASREAELEKASAEAAREEAEQARKEAEAANQTLATQMWQTIGQALLNERMRGEQDTRMLARNVIQQLCSYLKVQVGALYVVDGDVLNLAGTYAYRHKSVTEKFQVGESLVGEAALGKQVILVQVPDDYITIVSSSLGELYPRNVLFAPFMYEGQVIGVVEMGNLTEFTPAQMDFLNNALESIAVAFTTAVARARVNELLAETQQQAEELQAQSEELRVANEELETQTKSLQVSEATLKDKQAILDQQSS